MHMLNILALAGAATAAALQPRTVDYFVVSEFSAQHNPHSSESEVSFQYTNGDHSKAHYCSATKVTKYSNTIGAYKGYSCSGGNSGYFSLAKNPEGAYYLSITNGNGIHGTYTFDKSQDQFFSTKGGFTWEYINTTPGFYVYTSV